jgi:acetyl esterase/lipase
MMLASLMAVVLLGSTDTPGPTTSLLLCEANGAGIRTEVMRPSSGADGASIVYVHGGNWLDDEGLKQQFGLDDPVRAESRAQLAGFVAHGYVVFVPHYRGSPRFTFPAHIVDLKCAMRALRVRAAELGIDPDRMGVMGASAGGHLAALMGLAGPSAGWDSGPYPTVSSRPQAVATISAPVDLTGRIPAPAVPLLIAVFGTADPASAVLKQASPVTYISKDAPPFFLVHGEADRIVPYQSSSALHDALRAAGVDATFILVRHAGHELRPAPGYNITDPPAADLMTQFLAFFDRVLGRKPSSTTLPVSHP